MSAACRQRIGRAFSDARDYDRHAHVQRQVAQDLADKLARLALPEQPRVLEIGCGTGFLTAAAIARGIPGDWSVTDLSAEMVARCRARIGLRPSYRFDVLDAEQGERPAQAPFDLICASLAVQWFADLPAAIARLAGWLAPRGHLVFTTLAAGTFAEWREAHDAVGERCGLLALPQTSVLASMHPALLREPLEVRDYVDRPESARAFLRGLKSIGASTSPAAHRPLSPGGLRRVMRAFEATAPRATYEVVTCHYGNPE